MLAFACSGLQLALIVQSRGWLFTLPLVGLAVIFIVHERLRVIAAAIIPVAGALIPLHRLLAVYSSFHAAALGEAAKRAGEAALLICAAAFVIGSLLAWADSLWPAPTLSRTRRRIVGSALSAVAVLAIVVGGTVATHGHPFKFVSRQWNGFSQVQTHFSSQSHFGDVGSGRYDFWRVAIDALLAHPVGGLGEDNFADYYIKHRRTSQEPSWTHSIELRLLAQTGLVGFALFTAFMVGALRLAARGRRRGDPLTRGVAGIALLPLVVWLIHGSLDWFWEMPALSGPALGFLAVAASLAPGGEPLSASQGAARPRARRHVPRSLAAAAGIGAVLAGVVVLGLPYLSVREVSLASNVQGTDPAAALRDLTTAANLNPLSAEPGRLAGAIALRNGEWAVAEQRFRQTIAREPGGWFAWLGAGLATSALGERQLAHHYFKVAYSINDRQPAVGQALDRVYTKNPLTSAEAFKLFVIIQ
jgi:hypothetical protein